MNTRSPDCISLVLLCSQDTRGGEVYLSGRIRKGLFRHVWVMGGVGGRQNSYSAANVDGSGVSDPFSAPSPDLVPFLGHIFSHIFRFSAQNPSKRLELGQTKARNGVSTLKIGGNHAVSP